MELLMETKPYLLYETIAMLFRYVNGISFVKSSENVSVPRLPENSPVRKRAEQLQKIMVECCEDLDLESEQVQRYFGRVETNCVAEYTCLASMMTASLFQYRHHDLEGEVAALKAIWKDLLENGYRLGVFGFNILGFRRLREGEEPRSLMSQVVDLNYSAEIRLEIGHFLSDYDICLDEMVTFIRPYAEKLQACYQRDAWILDSTVEYWQERLQKHTLEKLMSQGKFPKPISFSANRCRLCLSLMDHNSIRSSLFQPEQLLVIMGCSVTIEASTGYRYEEPEEIGAALRSVSDKSKFEILRRLSQSRNYCQKLAEEMGCHPGNIFRNLKVLYKEGFLNREEKDGVIYYEVNRDAIEELFQNASRALLG